MNTTVECPVCLRDVSLDETLREGDVFQCPHCKVWLKLIRVNGVLEAERVKDA